MAAPPLADCLLLPIELLKGLLSEPLEAYFNSIFVASAPQLEKDKAAISSLRETVTGNSINHLFPKIIKCKIPSHYDPDPTKGYFLFRFPYTEECGISEDARKQSVKVTGSSVRWKPESSTTCGIFKCVDTAKNDCIHTGPSIFHMCKWHLETKNDENEQQSDELIFFFYRPAPRVKRTSPDPSLEEADQAHLMKRKSRRKKQPAATDHTEKCESVDELKRENERMQLELMEKIEALERQIEEKNGIIEVLERRIRIEDLQQRQIEGQNIIQDTQWSPRFETVGDSQQPPQEARDVFPPLFPSVNDFADEESFESESDLCESVDCFFQN